MSSVYEPQPTVVRYAWSDEDGTWLFVQEERVDYLVSVHRAIRTAETWKEFWSLLPTDERDNLKDQLKWLASDASADGDRETAKRYRPRLTDSFDSCIVPGVEEGDHPRVINRDEVEWIPKGIMERFGDTDSNTSGGTFVFFTQEDPTELLAAFADHGFTCVHDEESVLRAAGWRPHPSQPWQE